MAKPMGATIAEDCRYLLAVLIQQGYTLDEIATGCRDSVELIKDIWMSTGYDERGERLYLDLESLVRHNSFLPRMKKMLQQGMHLHERMGDEVWNDPQRRRQWLEEHSE